MGRLDQREAEAIGNHFQDRVGGRGGRGKGREGERVKEGEERAMKGSVGENEGEGTSERKSGGKDIREEGGEGKG